MRFCGFSCNKDLLYIYTRWFSTDFSKTLDRIKQKRRETAEKGSKKVIFFDHFLQKLQKSGFLVPIKQESQRVFLNGFL